VESPVVVSKEIRPKMWSSEPPRTSASEGRLSLILPLTEGGTLTDQNVADYRRILAESGDFESIEVILAGAGVDRGASPWSPDQRIGRNGKSDPAPVRAEGGDWSAWARAGLAAASGDHLIVLDVARHYCPESLARVLDPVRAGDSDLAVGVPTRGRSSGVGGRPSWWGLGLVSRLLLGSSDVFSGLFAIRRSVWEQEGRSLASSGSSLVLELLLRRPARCVDVPVAVGHRFRSHRMRLRDLRPLKHVLDGRFGNLSRLIQFCVVGASGMVVDLTFYALFQWLFSFTWLASRKSTLFGSSWQLVIAAALSIAIALLWNFSLNRRLTFNDARNGAWSRQFLTYALSNALAIALSFSVRLYLPARVGFFARHRLAAAVVGIVAATGISFSMSRWIVFARRGDRNPPAHFPPKTQIGRSSAVV
jgi:dolichol-phosphate mannosyltransferase